MSSLTMVPSKSDIITFRRLFAVAWAFAEGILTPRRGWAQGVPPLLNSLRTKTLNPSRNLHRMDSLIPDTGEIGPHPCFGHLVI